jgi:hypothetical protein
MILIYFPLNQLLAQNNEIARGIYHIEKEYGDVFVEALYSVDETRPYSIIQIDKVSMIYNNNWISPVVILKMLTVEDKKYLVDEIVKFLSSFDNQSEATAIVEKLKAWCLTMYQFDYFTDKLKVGIQQILLLLGDVHSGHVNANTGESVDKLNKQGDDEQEYYEIVNFMSMLKQNEQFKIIGRLFNSLAEKK